MRVDGEALARELEEKVREELATLGRRPSLRVLAVGSDSVTEQFVSKKRVIGERLGVSVSVKHLAPTADTEAIAAALAAAISEGGVVVQLPLPGHVDLDYVLGLLPASHDVDVLGQEARARFERGGEALLPPVVAAMRAVLARYSVGVAGKRVAVVGRGRLVGAPASIWFRQQGASVHTVAGSGADLTAAVGDADIIVLGAGVPGLLKPEMFREGAVVLDAGTSESAGRVVGDADPACAERAALFTPTPGGIGPVAVTMLFSNLAALCAERA